MPEKFLVIGDSHSLFFGVSPADLAKYPTLSQFKLNAHDYKTYPELANFEFHGHYLGAVLAKSLTENQSTLMARSKIIEILNQNRHIPKVILAFGEIDCKFHVVERLKCDRQTAMNEQVKNSIKATATRLLSFCYEVKAMGFNVYLWAPIASNVQPHHEVTKEYNMTHINCPDYPNYGTCKLRNERTLVFCDFLKQQNEIPVVSIFDDLVDENLQTKTQYYCDTTHLNKSAWKLALPKLMKLL